MRINRIVAMVLTVCLTLSFGSFASYEEELSQEEMAAIAKRVSEMLALEEDITTITVSERQMVEKLLESGEITEMMLREAVRDLQTKTTAELQAAGYSNMQIERIQGIDVHGTSVEQLLSSSSAYVTFQYGLITGLSDRNSVTIAYDIMWSECPLWTITDSFGVGWIAMNVDSLHVITDIDTVHAVVEYYTTDDEQTAYYRECEITEGGGCVIVAEFLLGSAMGNYGKHISGYLETSTANNSNNMYTMDIYVAYGHTYIYLTDFADYALDWITGEAGISFSPKPAIGHNLIFDDSKREYVVASSGGEAEEDN